MKKILLSFFLIFFAFTVKAEEYNLVTNSTASKWTAIDTGSTDITSASGFETTLEDFKISYIKYNSSDNPVTANASEIRVYTNSQLTVENINGETITKVVLNLSRSANITVDGITISPSGNTLTWTGTTDKFVAVPAAQIRITSIDVTTAGDATTIVEAPKFSPAAGTYYSTQDITITTETSGAKIYYTTNGDIPTSSSSEYTEPLKVTSTATIKAIAISGSESSSVVTSGYTIGTTVTTIPVWSDFTNGENIKINASLTAIFQSGQYLYLSDGTENMVVYGTVGKTYENGDVIPAGIEGVKGNYRGLDQLANPVASSFGDATKGIIINPIETTIPDVVLADVNKYILLKDVKISGSTLTNGTNSVALFDRFTTVTVPDDTEKTYNVTGFIGPNNSVVQVWPTSFDVVASVDNAFADSYSVSVSKGFIEITGSADTIEVYTIGGALISKDSAKIACSTGMYIVKVDGKATKVVVK